MKHTLPTLFVVINTISLFLVTFINVNSRLLLILGFFALPVSIIWLGVSIFSQGRRINNRKRQSFGIGVIVIGIIASVFVVSLIIASTNWSD